MEIPEQLHGLDFTRGWIHKAVSNKWAKYHIWVSIPFKCVPWKIQKEISQECTATWLKQGLIVPETQSKSLPGCPDSGKQIDKLWRSWLWTFSYSLQISYVHVWLKLYWIWNFNWKSCCAVMETVPPFYYLYLFIYCIVYLLLHHHHAQAFSRAEELPSAQGIKTSQLFRVLTCDNQHTHPGSHPPSSP